jgi:hypothetical protein
MRWANVDNNANNKPESKRVVQVVFLDRCSHWLDRPNKKKAWAVGETDAATLNSLATGRSPKAAVREPLAVSLSPV